MKRTFWTTMVALLLASTTFAQDKEAVEQIRKMGGLALEIAQDDDRLEVSFLSIDGKLSEKHLAPLKNLKKLVHLNLRGKEVTDDLMVYLKDLTSLTKLHLEKTKITDKGAMQLKGLTNLEYLNLYGTAVTDKTLEQLAGMKKLKKLYLWQTKVTDEGVAKLKKALPELYVNRGVEIAKPKEEPKKPEPKKPTKKEK